MCVLHLSKEEPLWSRRNSGNIRKAYGKVDQVFCLRGEKDLDMSIIGFTVRLTWHTGSHQHIQEISFFLYKFAFHSALQTNPYRSSPSTSLSLFIFSHRRAPLYYVLWPSVTFRSGVWVFHALNTSSSCHHGTGSHAVLTLLWKFYLAGSSFLFVSFLEEVSRYLMMSDDHLSLTPNNNQSGKGAVFLLYVVTY